MSEELALINCRQKKEICGDGVILSGGFSSAIAFKGGNQSTSGNYTMLDKFSSDSICGGGAGTYGTETDYSGVSGVNSLPTC